MTKLSRKEEIIQTACQLFRARGYSSTSVRDIAKEMQMEASSLYNHIKSKQEILSDVLLNLADLFEEGMANIKKAPITPLQKLQRLVELHVRITIEQTDVVALIPNDWIHLESPNIQKFAGQRDQYEKDFKLILKQCMKDGSIQKVNIEIASFSILSTLRWLYSWYIKNPSINPVELEEEMKKSLIQGLTK